MLICYYRHYKHRLTYYAETMLTEIILGGAVLLLLYWTVFGKPSGLPPGRWGLPLVGYIPLGGEYLDDTLADLQKKYGDIYIWRFGTQLQVYIHDYNLCRKLFASPDFTGRPETDALKFTKGPSLGVALSVGAIWHNNRRFGLRQLRDLGMGKSSLLSALHEEALIFLEALKESAGREEPITPVLNMTSMNVIWKMIANRRFDSNNPAHTHLQQLLVQMNSYLSAMFFADMMPWTKKIIPPSILRRISKADALDEAKRNFSEYFSGLIKEHKEALDPNDPKDMIDAYLIEMKEKKSGDAEGIRSEEDLKALCFDMFFAGSDSFTNAIKWLLLFMAAYPEVQRKMQQEIDQVLPKGLMVTLEDKTSLPYTEAVINETFRKSSFSNIGFYHTASTDATFAGYKFPKGTIVTSATASIHHDPRYWDKPDHFLPQRWLSPEGKFVMKKEGYLPFGNGKRGCIGEGLARMHIMIFTTAVFQNFSIAPPEGKQVDLLHNPASHISHDPRIQDVVFTQRG